MFKSAASRVVAHTRCPTAVVKRSIHNVPKLAKEELYQSQGINGLYSAKGFNTVWTDYQKFLTTKLTQLTMETENETRVPFQIVQNTARKPDQAHVFNYASQAFNNHLFVEALTEPSTNNTKPSLALTKKIEETWGSLDGLREDILVRADSLLGNGWVFLLEDADKSLYTMTSYGSGTPFDLARSQLVDFNGVTDAELSQEVEKIGQFVASNEKNHSIALLAVNVWEQAYLPDYSVAGRSEYLESWFQSINWDVVNSRYYPEV